MFTGLVQKVGLVLSAERKGKDLSLIIGAPGFFRAVKKGGSVAVDGCCLTAEKVSKDKASFQAVPETLRLTQLGGLRRGSLVNLELPLRSGDPLGGHLVQGHVDATAEVLSVRKEGAGKRLAVKVQAQWLPYLVRKGSVALDGVSLTVAAVKRTGVEVALVPHTLKHTTLGEKTPGDRLNLETDVVSKQVAQFLRKRQKNIHREVAKFAKKS
jgi:riboflavin synthase alpha subunit